MGGRGGAERAKCRHACRICVSTRSFWASACLLGLAVKRTAAASAALLRGTGAVKRRPPSGSLYAPAAQVRQMPLASARAASGLFLGPLPAAERPLVARVCCASCRTGLLCPLSHGSAVRAISAFRGQKGDSERRLGKATRKGDSERRLGKATRTRSREKRLGVSNRLRVSGSISPSVSSQLQIFNICYHLPLLIYTHLSHITYI